MIVCYSISLVNGCICFYHDNKNGRFQKYFGYSLKQAILKKELPEIAKKYSRTTETKRFIFS